MTRNLTSHKFTNAVRSVFVVPKIWLIKGVPIPGSDSYQFPPDWSWVQTSYLLKLIGVIITLCFSAIPTPVNQPDRTCELTMASGVIPLDTFNVPDESSPFAPSSDSVRKVVFRVREGTIRHIELSQNSPASKLHTTLNLYGDDDLSLEMLSYEPDELKDPSIHLIRTIRALPIVCMIWNAINLCLAILLPNEPHILYLIGPAVGCVFGLYHIPAAFLGGVHLRISFGLAIPMSLMTLVTSLLTTIYAEWYPVSSSFFVFAIYVVDIIILARLSKFPSCGPCCISCCRACCEHHQNFRPEDGSIGPGRAISVYL